MPAIFQKITPCLCFDNQAEHAVNFYTSIFEDSKIVEITYWGDEELAALSRVAEEIRPGPVGSVRAVEFQLFGQEYLAVNGGAHFTFNDGISFMVKCDTQEELDEMWEKLAVGGETLECGWLRDRFGVSWQIIPSVLGELISDPDSDKAQRVRKAVLQMKKYDIAALQRAYDGKDAV
jgi:predicted 3-demethylubiquinone-9 3-methyltransferase (glyoxalase superfamily)